MRCPLLVPAALWLTVALGGCALGEERPTGLPTAPGPDGPPQLEPDGPTRPARPPGRPPGSPAPAPPLDTVSATKNTTRLGGATPTVTAAQVALAVFPGNGPDSGPPAVALVDAGDWQGTLAAAMLAAAPVGAPVLLSEGGTLSPETRQAVARVQPGGMPRAGGVQVLRVGERAPAPAGLRSTLIGDADPYRVAAAVDAFASSLRRRPSSDVVVASGERPEWSMPAAAWAARSGDALLLVRQGAVPGATQRALRAHGRPDIFVLGPEQAVGAGAVRALRRFGRVRRVAGPSPVENAVEFARYSHGGRAGFGWGATVPGYNFTVASTGRPLDAAAAAALGSNGVFAPLLLSDDGGVPRALEDYLLDVQPGYEDDPGDGVYNRVWVLGPDAAISVGAQARLDEVTQLVPVRTRAP